MSENIELGSYAVRNVPDNNIEDYDEINLATDNIDSLDNFAMKYSPELLNGYDFFTQMDIKQLDPKKSSKKKKSKKKEITSNVMDIVSSELASMSLPISKNVVQLEDNRVHYNNYIRDYSRDQRNYQYRKTFLDSENGLVRRSRAENLRPVFPNLTDNLSDGDLSFAVQYVEPLTYEDFINKYNRDRDSSTNFVNVDLKNITFKHHHNFSLEDLLCKKLIDLYDTYKKIEEMIRDLSRNIKINRETKDNLKYDLAKVSPNKKDGIRFDATFRKYCKYLFEFKDKYMKALKDKQDVSHKIISLWSDIEMIRNKLDCKHTPYKLNVSKVIPSNKEYETKWNKLFEEEYTDMLTKIEYDFTSKCIQYKLSKNEPSDGKAKEEKTRKPRLEINEDELKEKVEQIVSKHLNKDEYDLNLENGIMYDDDVELTKNVYYFEIYLDNNFVCESEQYTNDNSYNVTCSESFSIEILPNNEIIKIFLVENNEKVAFIKVYLSEIAKNKNTDYNPVEFVYDKKILPSSDCVGSGNSIKQIAAVNKVRLKSSNTLQGILTTSCNVYVKINYCNNLDENLNEAIKVSWDIGNKLRRLMHKIDKPNIERLTEIIGNIYNKDVSSDDTMIETLRRISEMNIRVDQKFNVDDNSPESIRLKLLHLRNSGGFTYVDNKMIPINGSEITTEQLNCLQKTTEKDFDLNYLKDKEADMDPIELERFMGAKYMKKLNKKMLRNLNEHLMVKTQKDVVREFKDFSWRSLFSRENIRNTAASISNGAKHQILLESLTKEQEIQITVQRAFNFLDRSADLIDDDQRNEEMIAEPVSGYKVRPLRPFVRVSYHNAVAQTVTAIGCHPTWNHTLKLCTRLDPLTNLYIDVYDACKVNISEDPDDNAEEMTVHYRYCNKWLGTVQVPLFTVLSLGTLRGIFKINSPPVLFGYDTAQNKESRSLIPEVTQLMKKDTSYISLSITTGLAHLGGFQEYNQPLPCSVEDDYIIKHLNTFVAGFRNDFPNRNLSLTFIDSAGRNKCVTQFLQPMPMPDREFFPRNPKSCGSGLSKSSGVSRSSSSKSSGRRRDDLEASEEKESVHSLETNWKGDGLIKTISACMRYVSLIPCYEVCDTHVVTLMGVELLKVLHGSPLDHTLLLSSYFLYLGIKSWVAVGTGLPRGRSAYVMIQYDLTARRFVLTSDQFRSRGFLSRNEGYLWYVCDAVAGERHELRDIGCPMKTIDYLFDNENIWVNVQSSQDCENVSFDLTKSSAWQPVLSNTPFIKAAIVRDPSYRRARPLEALRRSIEHAVRLKVHKWRPHHNTVWNRYCSNVLRETLPQWEYWALAGGQRPAFNHKLKQLMLTYKMSGFPLNIPFVSTKSVLSSVKRAGLHAAAGRVEFALAVEVCPYPNDVISVWVFLATLTNIT